MTIMGEFAKDSLSTEPKVNEIEDRRVRGKIIKISEKGWGFITSQEIKFTRIFFHWTSLKQNTINFTDLKNGMKVEFTPIEIPDKGCRAIKIEVLNHGAKATEEKTNETSATT